MFKMDHLRKTELGDHRALTKPENFLCKNCNSTY